MAHYFELLFCIAQLQNPLANWKVQLTEINFKISEKKNIKPFFTMRFVKRRFSHVFWKCVVTKRGICNERRIKKGSNAIILFGPFPD